MSRKINAILIDDEDKGRENLLVMLQRYCPRVNVVAQASSAAEGLTAIKDFQPDLVFLDIEMPGGSGFEMLRLIKNQDFEVIFVTAYDRYGIQAIKYCAIDYLLKPLNQLDLCSAVDKAEERIEEKKENERLRELIKNMERPKEEKRLGLPTSNSIEFVETSSVIRCESDNNYTLFHLTNGHKIMVCKTLKEFEELLSDSGFVRPHQSHLVNVKYINSFVKSDGGYLKLKDETSIPVSRFKKTEIMRLINK